MREADLHERAGTASTQQVHRREGEAKAVSVAAKNYLAAHCENCPVCKGNKPQLEVGGLIPTLWDGAPSL